MKDRVEKAGCLFKDGYNCSQAVFAAYADLYGMDQETALKISSSFGAGMGRMREVCGAVTGMFMVAGLVTGNTDPKNQEAKKYNYEIVRKMAELFKEKHGSIICKEMLGLTKGEEAAEPAIRTKEYFQKRPCLQSVMDAAEIIEKVLLDKSV